MKSAENEERIDLEVWSAIMKVFYKIKATDGIKKRNTHIVLMHGEITNLVWGFLLKKNFLIKKIFSVILLHVAKEDEVFIFLA